MFQVVSRRFSTSRYCQSIPLILPRISVPANMEINLSQTETSICGLLDECARYLKSEKGIDIQCRVAGGWVRDKLLGLESNDMDIALSDIMGLPFAEHLAQFANSKGIATGRIAKIEQNPDQSKHLETATLKLFGQDIDLVNLRSEVYAEGSRIPTGVGFGTPLEDAMRRDITMNALFYNVHSGEVEDFTGKGLEDLRNGVIRTPLPPKQTFLDDPLRVLRCIRFSCRMGFTMVANLKDAAKDSVVQRALVEKVSRERVGDEITKMIQGRDPLGAAQLIHDLGLYHACFSVMPDTVKSQVTSEFLETAPRKALISTLILDKFITTHKQDKFAPHPAIASLLREDAACRARLYFASLLSPYYGLKYTDSKKRTQSAVTAVIRESLRLGTQNHYLDGIPAMFSAISLIQHGLEEHHQAPLTRAKVGLLLRNRLVHNPFTGSHWSTSILFSLLTDLVTFYKLQDNEFEEDAVDIFARYNSFADKIIEFGLENDIDRKPMLGGKEILAAFGQEKAGPWVAKVLEDVVEWQLGNPSSSKEDCVEWLRNRGIDRYIPNSEPARSRKRTRNEWHNTHS